MSSAPAKPRTSPSRGTWSQILKNVSTPLGFYVLALLIVEGTLTLVLTCSQLGPDKTWQGFLCMIGIFVAVVIIVTFFTMLNPKNLLYGKEEHNQPQVEPSALKDQIEDLIYKNVKSDCLKKSE